MKSRDLVVSALLLTFASASAFAGACPDFSGKYKIANLNDCHFKHYKGDRLLGEKIPPLADLYISADTTLEIKQNGCEFADYTLGESKRPDLRPFTGRISFGVTNSYDHETVRFTESSFVSVTHRAEASSNKGQAIPLPAGQVFRDKWGIKKEKNGNLKLFASGEGAGFILIVPLVHLYHDSCTFVPVRD